MFRIGTVRGFRIRSAATLAAAMLLGATAVTHAEADPAPLFASDETLELTLTADFKALRGDRDQTASEYRAGTITYLDVTGAQRSLEVGVKTRGRFRLQSGNCRFPQLFVRFSGDVTDSVFAGQKTLPLATHCRTSARHEQYVVQEYLVYRTFNVLTDNSLRVRSARVTYVDSRGKQKPLSRFAFFIEHFEAMAGRLGKRVVSIDGFYPLDADPYEIGLMNVFQYMVGNTDWSAIYQHNILLLQSPEQAVTAVPYDFDWSGVIAPRYAVPGENLPIKSVRERLYRGMCRPREQLDPVFAHFIASRAAIYALYERQEGLDPKVLQRSLSYYDKFYETLQTPEKLQRGILDACRSFGRPKPRGAGS